MYDVTVTRHLLLVFVFAACSEQSEQPNPSAQRASAVSRSAPRPEHVFPCLHPDSLVENRLWYSDAIYGTKWTDGGTLFTLMPAGDQWHGTIEAIWSDTREGEPDWHWPGEAIKVDVTFSDLSAGRVRLTPQANPEGMSRYGRPFDTLPSASWADSVSAKLTCGEMVLVKWNDSASDTTIVERRLGPGM